MSVYLKKETLPTAASWFLATTATVLLALSLGVGSLFLHGLHTVLLYGALHQAVLTNPSIQAAISDERLRPLVPESDEHIGAVVKLVHYLQNKRYEKAQELFDLEELPNHPYRHSVGSELAQIHRMQNQEEQQRSILSVSSGDVHGLADLYAILETDTRRALFGVEPKPVQTGEGQGVVKNAEMAIEILSNLAFYQAGELQGLPTMMGRSEPIGSPEELQEFRRAHAVKGSTLLSGKAFASRVEQLRQQAEVLQREKARLMNKIAEAQRVTTRAPEQVELLRRRALMNAKRFLVALTQPALPTQVALAYDTISRFGRHIGLSMPAVSL